VPPGGCDRWHAAGNSARPPDDPRRGFDSCVGFRAPKIMLSANRKRIPTPRPENDQAAVKVFQPDYCPLHRNPARNQTGHQHGPRTGKGLLCQALRDICCLRKRKTGKLPIGSITTNSVDQLSQELGPFPASSSVLPFGGLIGGLPHGLHCVSGNVLARPRWMPQTHQPKGRLTNGRH